MTGALHAIRWIWGPQNHPPKLLLWMGQLKKCAVQDQTGGRWDGSQLFRRSSLNTFCNNKADFLIIGFIIALILTTTIGLENKFPISETMYTLRKAGQAKSSRQFLWWLSLVPPPGHLDRAHTGTVVPTGANSHPPRCPIIHKEVLLESTKVYASQVDRPGGRWNVPPPADH